MDPENAVVKLCVRGMEEEVRGNIQRAASLFAQAWSESSNDFESCIAAHYVARHQPTADLTFQWNQEAIDRAKRVSDGSADEFFASLYLNLGKSYEDLGSESQAQQLYQCAAEKLMAVPAGAYRDLVQAAIDRAFERVGNGTSV